MTKRALREAVLALSKPHTVNLARIVDRLGRPDYTARNRALLEAGVHPATRLATRPERGTCGDCRHHVKQEGCKRRYHKCARHRLGLSNSAASDIRVSWPACEAFEARGPT